MNGKRTGARPAERGREWLALSRAEQKRCAHTGKQETQRKGASAAPRARGGHGGSRGGRRRVGEFAGARVAPGVAARARTDSPRQQRRRGGPRHYRSAGRRHAPLARWLRQRLPGEHSPPPAAPPASPQHAAPGNQSATQTTSVYNKRWVPAARHVQSSSLNHQRPQPKPLSVTLVASPVQAYSLGSALHIWSHRPGPMHWAMSVFHVCVCRGRDRV